MRLCALSVLGLAAALGTVTSRADDPPAARQLIGLWSARRHFGPRVRGPLTIHQRGQAWTAEIAGRTEPVKMDERERLVFGLPDQQGSFRGRLLENGRILGHWTQPRTTAFGSAFATPVVLERLAPGRWRGAVTPLEDELTFHMRVFMGGQHASGRVKAFLRNPERNLAGSLDVEEIVLDGSAVKVIGRRGEDATTGELFRGRYDAGDRTLSLHIPLAGGTFDFRRATVAEEAAFYPRARTPGPYAYVPPPEGPDGWPVGTLEEAGVSRDIIAAFVKALISTPIDEVHALDVHGVLMARRGKLVLEEYFHGFHRDALHDTDTASNVLLTAMAGAARLKATPVGLEAKADDAAAAGLELAAATGRPLAELFHSPVAGPLRIGHYALRVAPSGEPQAGGARLLPRDFLKLGQVMLDEGRWRGAAVVSKEWARRSAPEPAPSPAPEPAEGKDEADGYLWTATEFEYKRPQDPREAKARKVRGFYATGDGGQLLAVVPEMELVVGFHGGNYGDPMGKMARSVFVPNYILPAVN